MQPLCPQGRVLPLQLILQLWPHSQQYGQYLIHLCNTTSNQHEIQSTNRCFYLFLVLNLGWGGGAGVFTTGLKNGDIKQETDYTASENNF